MQRKYLRLVRKHCNGANYRFLYWSNYWQLILSQKNTFYNTIHPQTYPNRMIYVNSPIIFKLYIFGTHLFQPQKIAVTETKQHPLAQKGNSSYLFTKSISVRIVDLCNKYIQVYRGHRLLDLDILKNSYLDYLLLLLGLCSTNI